MSEGSEEVSMKVLWCSIAIALVCGVSLAAEAPQAQAIATGDAGPFVAVREIRVTGNTLIATDTLLGSMPAVYNASGLPLDQAAASDVYDLASLRDVIGQPGAPRQISVRAIQGLTRYMLSVYERAGYGGIYVHVPKEVLAAGQSPADGILTVNVLELPVSEVTVQYHSVDGNDVEKGYLRESALKSWSPAKPGEVVRKRDMDYMLNLLNLDPDRHVTASVASGKDPNTLAVNYDVYESSPWHFFLQTDNSGTRSRRWSPRIGVINTNLLGFDDKFTAVYQAKPDNLDDQYSIVGSYDFPLAGPRLRLTLFGGHSEFDINPQTGNIGFLGSGTFYGGTLRYNLLQHQRWFWDVTGTLAGEESRITPSLFPQFLASQVRVGTWSVGTELHRRTDMSNTSLGVERTEAMGGADRQAFQRARINAEPDFRYYTVSANHNFYMDRRKVHHLRQSLRWVTAEDRLIPSRMTAFGGLYTVRGYDEYEVIADGGLLASVQYEYDLIRADAVTDGGGGGKATGITKLAPLVFFDYGRSKIVRATPGERRHEELMSVGLGGLLEIGPNFVGAVYWGYPLNPTSDTHTGKGSVGVTLMLRN